MNTLLFIFMLFVAGLLFLYVVKPAPKHAPTNAPKNTPLGDEMSYEPRWERKDPHGVWMGDKFFHALNPFVPGNPNWADAKLGGYDIYFEVDTQAYDITNRPSSIEVMLHPHFIHVEVNLWYGPYGPNDEANIKIDTSISLDEGRGWAIAAEIIENLVTDQYLTIRS